MLKKYYQLRNFLIFWFIESVEQGMNCRTMQQSCQKSNQMIHVCSKLKRHLGARDKSWKSERDESALTGSNCRHSPNMIYWIYPAEMEFCRFPRIPQFLRDLWSMSSRVFVQRSSRQNHVGPEIGVFHNSRKKKYFHWKRWEATFIHRKCSRSTFRKDKKVKFLPQSRVPPFFYFAFSTPLPVLWLSAESWCLSLHTDRCKAAERPA